MLIEEENEPIKYYNEIPNRSLLTLVEYYKGSDEFDQFFFSLYKTNKKNKIDKRLK